MTALSVSEAVHKELRDHELPCVIEGWLIVTEHFSYLVDDINLDNGSVHQPSVLLAGPDIYHSCTTSDQLVPHTAGLVLYQEWAEVRGVLLETGCGIAERQLYRMEYCRIITEDEQELIIHPPSA